jgi:uncharacterized repeat protein (TIGR01451 family)
VNANITENPPAGNIAVRVVAVRGRLHLIYRNFLAGLGCVALLSAAVPAQAATAPSLGTAQSFAVLGGSTVTNTGSTIVAGDLGIWPGLAVTGFPPGLVTPPGTIHAGDATASSAQSAVTAAYNDLAGQPCDTDLTGQDLGGLTLTPGTYCFSTSAQLTGTLTLDAQGDSNAVFVIKTGSTLTTASGASVALINSAQSCNMFWQVGSSATLGTNTDLAGNILALSSITMNTGAALDGRALARNGATTLDTNTAAATVCSAPPPSPAVGIFKVFSPSTILPGEATTLTITLTNSNAGAATLSAAFTDAMPTGVTIVGSPSTTCGGTPPTVLASSVTLPIGATIPGGSIAVPGACTLTVNVTATNAGSYLNTLPVLVTDLGSSPAVPEPGVLLNVLATGIPTLSTWSTILLATLLALAGFAILRRRSS